MFLNLINCIIYHFWLIQIFNSKPPWLAWIINMWIIIISPVTGYAHCEAEHDQFPSHIWIGSQRGIHSCTSYLKQVDLTEPMPLQVKPQLMSSNLKSCFGHEPLAVNFIRGILCLGCWFQFLKTFPAMPCLHSTTCIHSYGVQSTPVVLNGCWPFGRFCF